MRIIEQDATAPPLRPYNRADVGGFDVATVPVDRVVSGSSSSTDVLNDIVENVVTGATIDHESFLVVNNISLEPVDSFESLNPSILTVTQDGVVGRVSSGTAGVLVKVGGATRRVDVAVSRTTGQSTKSFNSWVEGSMGADAADNVDTRLAGKTPVTNQPIWTTRNHAAPSYVRNPGCWAYDYSNKLTAVSVWNSDHGDRKTLTAVTRRHCIGVCHYNYMPAPGSIVRFITADNQIVERTVLRRVYPAGYTQPVDQPDLGICLLNEDLPESIAHIPVLPSNWNDYLIEITKGRPPVLSMNRAGDAIVKELHNLNSTTTLVNPLVSREQRSLFKKDLVTGDSGNPSFLLLGSELVYLTSWTTAHGGNNVASLISILNGLIETADNSAGISTGYVLQGADLSAFTNFND